MSTQEPKLTVSGWCLKYGCPRHRCVLAQATSYHQPTGNFGPGGIAHGCIPAQEVRVHDILRSRRRAPKRSQYPSPFRCYRKLYTRAVPFTVNTYPSNLPRVDVRAAPALEAEFGHYTYEITRRMQRLDTATIKHTSIRRRACKGTMYLILFKLACKLAAR